MLNDLVFKTEFLAGNILSMYVVIFQKALLRTVGMRFSQILFSSTTAKISKTYKKSQIRNHI